MTNVLAMEQVSYKRNLKTILQGVDLTLATGKIVGLLGENGAGKTTLPRGKGQLRFVVIRLWSSTNVT